MLVTVAKFRVLNVTLCCFGISLLPSFCDFHICFRIVCLSVSSVPSLSLKVPQIGNDSIYPELLMVVIAHWSQLSGCHDNKNSPLTINNCLLEHIGVTIIDPIYLLREIVTLLFSLQTVFLSFLEVQETEKELLIWTETFAATQSPQPPSLPQRVQLNSTANFSLTSASND